jgi:threonine/homoserine/homoserine lactone efflux protein
MTELWLFVGSLAVAYLVPGPDMVLLLRTGATQGRAHALATATGLAAARAAHVALAGFGLAALLRTAPVAFDIVRLVGVAYLVWLGIGILRSPSLLPDGTAAGSAGPQPYGLSIRRGLLTNLLNPKALLFCSVLLPQFVRPDQGSVPQQFLMLGAVLVVVGLAFDAIYAVAGAGLGRWVARHPIAQAIQRWTFASLLIGFGARLALAGRAL